MKIQIMSFPRSGTSLTRRILKRHPHVEAMFFEKLLLHPAHCPTKKKLLKKYPVFGPGRNCGEKNIYGKSFYGKEPQRPDHLTPITYCKKWNKFFGDEARLIQIVRHPHDVWNSMIRKKYMRRRMEEHIVREMKGYFNFFPVFIEEMRKFPNCLSIKYEELVMNPEVMIKKIYDFCNLDSSFVQHEKMKEGRVFCYKAKGHAIEVEDRVRKYRDTFFTVTNEHIDDTIKALNKIPGPKYEVK